MQTSVGAASDPHSRGVLLRAGEFERSATTQANTTIFPAQASAYSVGGFVG